MGNPDRKTRRLWAASLGGQACATCEQLEEAARGSSELAPACAPAARFGLGVPAPLFGLKVLVDARQRQTPLTRLSRPQPAPAPRTSEPVREAAQCSAASAKSSQRATSFSQREQRLDAAARYRPSPRRSAAARHGCRPPNPAADPRRSCLPAQASAGASAR